ncbi:bifunctional biotin--[acetyl-CoA-carboxylase] ligase/biotin operon repressor BirA [Porticoccus sp.]
MDRLLTILADGDFHSGEELGKVLGFSRTAVWKQIQKLAETGLEIESHKGCGYRLPGGLDLLDERQLNEAIAAGSYKVQPRLSLYGVVTSTNELARLAAESGDATGSVYIAEQQTKGRGRRGRQWVSPLGRNIYLSTVWGFDGGVQALEGLSLAVGVSVRRALESCGVGGLTLKWPNDLLWQKKKLGGILLEVLGDPAGFCQVVIGVGINLNMQEEACGLIDQAWTDVNQIAAQPVARNNLTAVLVRELFSLLTDYDKCGFSACRDEWMCHDAFANQSVTLELMNKSVQGIARGVNESGALLVEIDGELQVFSGGEISLRAST